MQTASNPNGQTTTPIAPGAEWVRPADCRALFGISRSAVYELITRSKDGQPPRVKSVVLRKPMCSTGTRLVNVESLRAYIASFAEVTA